MIAPEDDLLAHRRRKLATLRTRGEAFPNTFRRRHLAAELAAAHGAADKEQLAGLNATTAVAGRVVLRRVMGRASFVTLADSSGRIQCYLRKDALGDDAYEDFLAMWDLGDIVGVQGTLMKTNKGELTVAAAEVQLLVKSLRPLPEKHHGLSDQEARYRQRHVDLIANQRTRAVFERRAQAVRSLRGFFDQRGFLEVETPMMHPIPGGAAARPFKTHHNSLDMDLYLRVAPELYLKRLLVGGLERVYEINRCFRNEGLSPRHNPEFTTIEFYQAFADHHDLMRLTEELIRHLLAELGLGETVAFEGQQIHFGGAIARRTMREAVAQATGEREEELADAEKLAALARRLGIVPQAAWGWGRLLMEIFEAHVEPTLVQPIFITGHPAEVSPLARRNEDDPAIADRFELFVAGREIANGFSELNDPEDQAQRFHAQAALRDQGDGEAMHYDQDFVTALEHGMPPAAGEGIGVDRLVMLLTDSPNIREVVLFPLLRPAHPSRHPSRP